MVVKRHLHALLNITVPVGNSQAVRNVTSLAIQFLRVVVAWMESHTNADDIGTACDLCFCTIQQSRGDAPSAESREYVQVLDLGNAQPCESRIGGYPVYGDVAGELSVNCGD